MMTIDEAIKHAEEVAIDQDLCCSECAEEHRQLAEWLKDYKQLREGIDKAIALLEYLKKCKAKDARINSKVYFEYNTVMYILERIVHG